MDSMPTYELMFVLDDIGELGDPRVDAAESELDAVFERHGDLCLVTVSADGLTAVGAGDNAIHSLSSAGFTVLRSYPDLVNRTEIAERLNVTRQAIGNWVRGERLVANTFPTPCHLAAGGLWLWGDVVQWRRTNQIPPDDDELRYPSINDHIAIDTAVQPERRTRFVS